MIHQFSVNASEGEDKCRYYMPAAHYFALFSLKCFKSDKLLFLNVKYRFCSDAESWKEHFQDFLKRKLFHKCTCLFWIKCFSSFRLSYTLTSAVSSLSGWEGGPVPREGIKELLVASWFQSGHVLGLRPRDVQLARSKTHSCTQTKWKKWSCKIY